MDCSHIAAIVTPDTALADRLLLELAASLGARGLRVRGLVQSTLPECCGVQLTDLASGEIYAISQNLGPESSACRIDTAQIAEASRVMRQIECEGADLAIFNRFGGLEASGTGFAAEMLELMSRGQLMLTVVPKKHLAAWREFTGGLALELPAELSPLLAWFEQQHAAGQDPA